jgi:hypothetical protein
LRSTDTHRAHLPLSTQYGQAGIKFEIRSPKLETISKVQKDNDSNSFGRDRQCFLGVLDIASFGFVSDFGFRASNFLSPLAFGHSHTAHSAKKIPDGVKRNT